jgi:predicted  nucleic acid-binding Zn ribbon protein
MYVTRISFSRMNSPAQGEESSTETVDRVLGTWRMNGQVCGREWPFVSEGSGYSITALTPERNSLESVFNSSYVTAALARAEAEGLHMAWQSLGLDAESSPACSCANPSAYVLFTTYVTLTPPIRCMDCFQSVPLYRMKPMDSGEFYEVICWQSDYQSCDGLQMNCRVLERAATQEMSDLNSSLTEAGRKNCQTLAASSGRPFYYYLYQDSGESHQAELARRCPGCDGEWKLASCLHSHFDFKCDCCNLLSNIAFDLRG